MVDRGDRIQLHGDTVARALHFVLLDLVDDHGAADRAGDGRRRIPATAADLMTNDASGDAAEHRSGVDRLVIGRAIDLDGRDRALIDLILGDRAIFDKGRHYKRAHQEAQESQGSSRHFNSPFLSCLLSVRRSLVSFAGDPCGRILEATRLEVVSERSRFRPDSVVWRNSDAKEDRPNADRSLTTLSIRRRSLQDQEHGERDDGAYQDAGKKISRLEQGPQVIRVDRYRPRSFALRRRLRRREVPRAHV